MTPIKFEEAVRRFCNLYAQEYAELVSWNITDRDPGSLAAKVELKTLFDDERWVIPIGVSDEGKAAIDIDEAGFLSLDAGGFYCFLWHEACKRLRTAKDTLVTCAQAEELRKEGEVAP
jgi:hypothetical protein